MFRGLTVVGMIFVNNPGDWGHLYWPFDHAEWHGWTPTDLIFPWFLFIVGVAGVFSLEKRMAGGTDRLDLARHAFRRGMTIVVVGWLMAFYPFMPFLERLSRLRIPGVLPRIGVVFVFGTWIVLAVWGRRVAGVAVTVVVLLALHTWILLGTGYDLTPAGNVQRAVDLAVLKGHLWKNAAGWDPEGIVSTLTAIATMLTGTLTGFLLRGGAPVRRKVVRLFVWGAVATAAGLLLGRALPINKNLWTASYVVFTSGAALVTIVFWWAVLRVFEKRGWFWKI